MILCCFSISVACNTAAALARSTSIAADSSDLIRPSSLIFHHLPSSSLIFHHLPSSSIVFPCVSQWINLWGTSAGSRPARISDPVTVDMAPLNHWHLHHLPWKLSWNHYFLVVTSGCRENWVVHDFGRQVQWLCLADRGAAQVLVQPVGPVSLAINAYQYQHICHITPVYNGIYFCIHARLENRFI